MAKKAETRKNDAGKNAEKVTIGQKLRSLNILFPWFKVVAGFLMGALMVVVAIGMVRRGGSLAGNAEGGGEVSEVEVVEVDAGESGTKSEVKRAVVYIKAKPDNLAVRGREVGLEGKKLIALTFDDGPSYATTVRLLDILKAKGVKATFFVIGRMAQAAPDILQREEQEGHVVGSHTMGHVNLAGLDATAIRQDVSEIDGVFQGSLEHATRLTRPPYGEINETVKAEIKQPLVIWSIDPEDWKTKDAATIRRHVTERAFDGAIVLMHDIYGSTVDAVEGMIDDLRKEGYEFVTVPEMARVRGVALEAGGVYGSFRP